MKTFSIEYLHTKLDRHIKLVASYLERPEIDWIIRSARLKPYRFVFDNFDKKLILHDWWIDEYGNSLVFNKKKKIQIIEGDIRINHSKLVSSDLYGSLEWHRVSQFSKLTYYLHSSEDYEVLGFVGLDGFLRVFSNFEGEWNNYSPLLLGIETLQEIYRNFDLETFIELKNIKNNLNPCLQSRAWVSSWPPTKNFTLILREQNGSVLDTIKGI